MGQQQFRMENIVDIGAHLKCKLILIFFFPKHFVAGFEKVKNTLQS